MIYLTSKGQVSSECYMIGLEQRLVVMASCMSGLEQGIVDRAYVAIILLA